MHKGSRCFILLNGDPTNLRLGSAIWKKFVSNKFYFILFNKYIESLYNHFIQATLLTMPPAPRRVSSSYPLLAKPMPFLKTNPNLMFWFYPPPSASPKQTISLDPSTPMALNSYAPPGTKQTHLHLDTAQSPPWNSSNWKEPTAPLSPMLRP